MADELVERFAKLDTTCVSDAMDRLGVPCGLQGIRPVNEGTVMCGRAFTVHYIPCGVQGGTVGDFLDDVEAGQVIVIDNGGRIDTSCWGGILANGAKVRGISGVVIDGACRDLDDCIDIDFPVFARGTVVATARGRIMEQDTNVLIQFGGAQVRPGDVVMGDSSGVVVVPWERVDEVLDKADELFEKEERMIQLLREGVDILEVDDRFAYEKMLSQR